MPAWTEQTLRANGIDIHFWRTRGRKPPLILLHGLTDNGRCWQPVAEAIGGEYDLIAPDARGHGLSSAPASGYRTEDRAADVIGLLDALGLERVVVIGHSMGGETATWLAAAAPDRIRAAIMEDPPFRDAVPAPTFANDWVAGLRAQQALTHAELMVLGREQHPTWAADIFDPWAEAKLQVRQQVFSWLAAPATDWRSLVARITAPSLLITGEPERGAIVTPAVAEEISRLAPAVRSAQMPGAGHCIRFEQLPAYLAVVRGLLHEIFG